MLGKRVATLALVLMTLIGCGNESGSVLIREERTWTDASRITRGAARELRVVLWYPKDAEHLPLLVMAHGFGGLPEKFESFARTIAETGFVVAAPAFPYTNENTPGGHSGNLGDVLNQPGDVTFVLDQLLSADIASAINPDQISIFGHSLGGVTTLGLIRHANYSDPRIRAAIVANAPPGVESAFRGAFEAAAIPVMILHGTADEVITYASAPDLYASFDAPRVFVGILGAMHSDAYEFQLDPPTVVQAAARQATIAFLQYAVEPDVDNLSAALDSLSDEGHTVDIDASL